MKAHDKGNDNAATNAEKKPPPTEPKTETPVGNLPPGGYVLINACLVD
jgi:hypothetical protein